MIVLRQYYSLEERDFTFRRRLKYQIRKGRVKLANKIKEKASKNSQLIQEASKRLELLEKNSRGDYREVAKNLYKKANELGASVISINKTNIGVDERIASGRLLVNGVGLVSKENKKRGLQKALGKGKKYLINIKQKASKNPAPLAHEMGHATVARRYKRDCRKHKRQKNTDSNKASD